MAKSSSQTPTTHSIPQGTIQNQEYRRYLYLVGLCIVMGIGSILSVNHYQRQRNERAQGAMYQAVYYFEQDAFKEMLHGDGTCIGLLEIVKTYRFTKAANLAHFYIGVAYMHQADYTKAMQHLAKFKTKSKLLQARAWSLMGDARMEQGNYASASRYYMKAANHRPNKVFTPTYLVKAALAFENAGNKQKACNCYQRIVQAYPEAEQYGEACKHVARLSIQCKQ